MEYRRLGSTELKVSALCLGTMTFGEQNDERDAFAQLDAAIDAGITYIDTAEMYAVPPRAATYGLSETILGKWLRARGTRDRLVIGTKVLGRSPAFPYVRDGNPRLNRANITAAIDASLRRLGTDCVDIYWLHWPDRTTNFFGPLSYAHVEEDSTPLLESLSALDEMVKAGKIRHAGMSNETPWGAMTYLRLAEKHGLPRMVGIQNPASLLNRSFEIGLAEIAIREQCGLHAYSPLGHGVLSGKYVGGQRPADARLTLFPQYQRYFGPRGEAATKAYVDLAHRFGFDPAGMALAFLRRRPYVTSVILGATTLDQLAANLKGAALDLPEAVIAEIEAIHDANPNPCP